MKVTNSFFFLFISPQLICSTNVPHITKSVYFLGPGDGSLSRSELMEVSPEIDPTFSTNNISPFPYPHSTPAVYGFSGGVLNKSITLCGGADHGGNVFQNCFSLSSNTTSWRKFPPMLSPRAFASGTAVLNNSLIIIGGRSGGTETLATSEVYDNGRWKGGPSLPYPVEQHCSVALNSTHMLVIGGLGSVEPIKRYSSSFILDTRSGIVTTTREMVNGGRSGHGCTLLQGGLVLVVGGDSYPGDVGRTVEVFNPSLNIWNQGPRLPEDIDGTPGLVADVGGRVFLIGGYSEEGISDGIYQGDGKSWWKIGVKMSSRRGIFPIFEISSNVTHS